MYKNCKTIISVLDYILKNIITFTKLYNNILIFLYFCCNKVRLFLHKLFLLQIYLTLPFVKLLINTCSSN